MRRIAIFFLSLCGASALAELPSMPEIETRPAPSAETAPADIVPETPAIPPLAPDTQPGEEVVAPPASLPSFSVEEKRPAAALQFSLSPDHPSGLYFARDQASIDVIVELPSWAPAAQTLSGEIQFVALAPAAGAALGKPLSVTPIQEAQIKPGKKVKLTVAATFPAPGEYCLTIGGKKITWPGGEFLRCIFAPRGAEGKVIDNSWTAMLPPGAAEIPGFIADYAKRTGVRRFVLDEKWGPLLTREVNVLTRGKRELLLKNLAEAKATLILRLSLASSAKNEARQLAAMNRYVSTWIVQAKNTISAVGMDAGNALPAADFERVRAYYLSVYDAVKRQNKSIAMLGAGSFSNTEMFLTSPPAAEKTAKNLREYVDILTTDDSPADLRRGLDRRQLKEWNKATMWIVPRGGALRAAEIKTLGLPVIPANLADRNVAPHLLGGAVLTERLHAESQPFVAVFQGDGYAVAALGQDSNTIFGGEPKADPRKPHFEPPTFRTATGDDVAVSAYLEVADDTNSMRVVDFQGSAVDCRSGDLLKIPLNSLNYLLATGSAEELAGLLKTATPHGVPAIDADVTELSPPARTEKGSLTISLKNISPQDAAGEVTLLEGKETIGSAKKIAPMAPGKQNEMTFTLPAGTDLSDLKVEIRLKGASEVQVNKISAGK